MQAGPADKVWEFQGCAPGVKGQTCTLAPYFAYPQQAPLSSRHVPS